MRVLYVIDSLAPGGAETSLAEMAPGLIARGIDLHVLPLGSAHDLAPRLTGAGAVVHEHGGRPGRVGNVRAVLDLAGRLTPDLVHTTLYESDIAGRTAARLGGVPSSTSLVNDSYNASHRAETQALKLAGAQALDRLTAQFARRFHAITEAIATSVAPRLGIHPELIEVIPRGRDPQRYPFRDLEIRARTRAALGVDPATPVILAVGRQEPQKGLQHLLAAAPVVALDHPGVVLLIAGREGRASADLQAIVAGIDVDVRFLGHRTDVPDLLSAADVFCFPSEREGFGGVLIEALAVGCPIVGSAIPTSLEVLGEDRSIALLSPVGDHAALTRDLHEALAGPAASGARAERGRSRFEERFTIDSVNARMVGFFANVVQGSAT